MQKKDILIIIINNLSCSFCVFNIKSMFKRYFWKYQLFFILLLILIFEYQLYYNFWGSIERKAQVNKTEIEFSIYVTI